MFSFLVDADISQTPQMHEIFKPRAGLFRTSKSDLKDFCRHRFLNVIKVRAVAREFTNYNIFIDTVG